MSLSSATRRAWDYFKSTQDRLYTAQDYLVQEYGGENWPKLATKDELERLHEYAGLLQTAIRELDRVMGLERSNPAMLDEMQGVDDLNALREEVRG